MLGVPFFLLCDVYVMFDDVVEVFMIGSNECFSCRNCYSGLGIIHYVHYKIHKSNK